MSRGRAPRLLGLAAAVGAGIMLLALPQPEDPAPPVPSAPPAVDQVWPRAPRRDLPARLPDGSAWSPVWFLGGDVALGTAPTPDGRHLRLLRRAADGGLRELRRLPATGNPQFAGFTAAGTEVAWAETVAGPDGRGRTELWAVDPAGEGAPRRVTADTGDALFVNSRHDLVVDGGRLRWAAAGPGGDQVTELRSVPVGGGPVEVRTEAGSWTPTAWPWLVGGGDTGTGPVRLRNLADGTVREVPAGPDELVTCTPSWCRVLVPGAGGQPRIDLMRPDGRDRHRVAGGDTGAALIDVAVRDRFEVLSVSDPSGGAVGAQQLRLYDIERRRTVLVADRVGLVLCRGDVLWWSTGEPEADTWHTLDLRGLT